MGKVTTYSDGSTPSICIIGAGFSGLTVAIKLKESLGLTTFTIYDKNEDVGGVWLVNSYPGCAVDAPVHLYSWSFEPNPNWSLCNAPQTEILEYIQKTARKYDLYPHIKLNHVVQFMKWEEVIRKWRVTILNLKTNIEQDFLYDVVINGNGALSTPNIPSEFATFKGPVMHSAQWDESVELENKIVAVVGSGSSAVQIIPSLANTVKELHCYQRSATWVFPSPRIEYSSLTKWIFANIPFAMKLFRWYQFWDHEQFHKVIIHNSKESQAAKEAGRKVIESQTRGNPELRKKLQPGYSVGCSMVSKSSTYYKALAEPNVSLHTDHILEITADSILTKNGTIVKPDVIILATGFKYQDFLTSLPIVGKDSKDFVKEWRNDKPRNYYGICTHVAPNNFIILGPNGTLGHNSSLFIMECQVNFVIDFMRKLMQSDYRQFSVKLSVENEYMKELEELIDKTVWAHEKCTSFYRNGKGIHTAFYAGTGVKYWNRTRSADLTKFDLS